MNLNKNIKNIIFELKQAILKSRYQAVRLVNKELILLYFGIGQKISETASKEAWGTKVIDHISTKLQYELPGLRGFSSGNLKKMRVFAEFWMINLKIGSAMPNQFHEFGIDLRSLLTISMVKLLPNFLILWQN